MPNAGSMKNLAMTPDPTHGALMDAEDQDGKLPLTADLLPATVLDWMLPEPPRAENAPKIWMGIPGTKVNGKSSRRYWNKFKHPFSGEMTLEMAESINQHSALTPVPMPEEIMWKNAKHLGLPKEHWQPATLKAANDLAQTMTMQLTARLLMIRGFSSMEQIELAFKVLGNLAQNAKSDSDKAFAASMIAKTVDAQRQLSAQILAFAERQAETKGSRIRTPLPPQVAVQLNVGGALPTAQTSPVAITGSEGVQVLPPDV